MKVFTKLFVVAACALLAFSAVSCANNSNGGKGDLSGSNAISQSSTEYRYTDSTTHDLIRIYFTSGSTWEYKTTIGGNTTLVSKGTYSTSGSTVTFTTTWVPTGSTLPSTTSTGTLSSDKKTLVVDGVTFTKQ